MNIRKNIDYTDMYAALDIAMEKDLSQVELYYEIGKAVCQRSEKGAAVAAAAYLSKQYPDAQGFSPRNLRRMRDFYRTYEDYPDLLAEALEIGWTQNVVIMEAELTVDAREWYLKAEKRFAWSKVELADKIASDAYEAAVLTACEEELNPVGQKTVFHQDQVGRFRSKVNNRRYLIRKARLSMKSKKGFKRRCFMWPHPVFTKIAKHFHTMLATTHFTNVLDFYRNLCYTGHAL